METAAAFLNDKPTVFAMWDLFSNERVRDNKRFSMDYPKDTVISFMICGCRQTYIVLTKV